MFKNDTNLFTTPTVNLFTKKGHTICPSTQCAKIQNNFRIFIVPAFNYTHSISLPARSENRMPIKQSYYITNFIKDTYLQINNVYSNYLDKKMHIGFNLFLKIKIIPMNPTKTPYQIFSLEVIVLYSERYADFKRHADECHNYDKLFRDWLRTALENIICTVGFTEESEEKDSLIKEYKTLLEKVLIYITKLDK